MFLHNYSLFMAGEMKKEEEAFENGKTIIIMGRKKESDGFESGSWDSREESGRSVLERWIERGELVFVWVGVGGTRKEGRG